eukprot:330919_1
MSWGAAKVEEEVEVKVEPPADDKPKLFVPKRRGETLNKPNTDSVQEFPTLDMAATDTSKPSPIVPSPMMADRPVDTSSRPRLALQKRTAPLPATPVPVTEPIQEKPKPESPVKTR